jgi:LemA protein
MIVFAIIIAVVVVFLYVWYMRLIRARNRVLEALGDVEAHLQQRLDLVPNVLTVARRFMEHEKTLLDDITVLRAKAQPQSSQRELSGGSEEKFRSENALASSMTRLFALAENYPQLTSSGPMLEVQRTYRDVETNIAAARRFYNNAVSQLKTPVEIFPGPLLAKLAGVREIPPFFHAEVDAAQPVSAAKHL